MNDTTSACTDKTQAANMATIKFLMALLQLYARSKQVMIGGIAVCARPLVIMCNEILHTDAV